MSETYKSFFEKNRIANPRRFGAFVLALTVTAGIGAYIAKDNIMETINNILPSRPSFSIETDLAAIPEGGGIDDAVFQIKGIENIDYRIARDYVEQMPENADTLKDGLQYGEYLVIPDHVVENP